MHKTNTNAVANNKIKKKSVFKNYCWFSKNRKIEETNDVRNCRRADLHECDIV